MKKLVVLIIFCCVQVWCSAQEHQFLNKTEVLVANNVYRMDEYDVLDSVGFLEKFSNGYYSIYNDSGLVIKANNYYSYDFAGEEPQHDEYNNYYFYDSKNRQIGFIQQFIEGDEPFRIVGMKELSEDGNSGQHAMLKPSSDGTTIVFEELKKRDVGLNSPFEDTLKISDTHFRIYGDSNESSSLMLDIYYSENGLIDSTVTTNNCIINGQSSVCKDKVFFYYDQHGNSTSKRFESHANTSEINPWKVRTVVYNQFGLIEAIETKHLDLQSKEETELRKFIYTFRSDD